MPCARHNADHESQKPLAPAHPKMSGCVPGNRMKPMASSRMEIVNRKVRIKYLMFCGYGSGLTDFFCIGSFASAQKTDQLVKGAEGAYPAAEKPPQKHGQYYGENPPQKPCIQGSGAQQGGQSHQRIQLNEPVDGPSAQLPPLLAQGGDHAEPEEEDKEENLADASGGDDIHVWLPLLRLRFHYGCHDGIQFLVVRRSHTRGLRLCDERESVGDLPSKDAPNASAAT